MADELLVQIVEGVLLAAGKPLTVADIAALFEEHEQPGSDAIRASSEASISASSASSDLISVPTSRIRAIASDASSPERFA